MAVTVGIIGGTGRMGKWFAKFFRGQKCRVLVSGRNTKLKPEELVRKSDVVIFSVPIGVTASVIRKCARHARPGSALADFTSIKKQPVKEMLKRAPRGVEVVGMHPVFGPKEKGIKGQTVVLCPARGKKWLAWFRKIFRKSGAKVVIASPEKHDRTMAVVQALTHFSILPAAYALKEMRINLRETMRFTSPLYRKHIAMAMRMLGQNPRMYAEILTMNPHAVKAASAYLMAAKRMEKAVRKRDSKRFEKYLEEAAAYFSRSGIKAF